MSDSDHYSITDVEPKQEAVSHRKASRLNVEFIVFSIVLRSPPRSSAPLSSPRLLSPRSWISYLPPCSRTTLTIFFPSSPSSVTLPQRRVFYPILRSDPLSTLPSNEMVLTSTIQPTSVQSQIFLSFQKSLQTP